MLCTTTIPTAASPPRLMAPDLGVMPEGEARSAGERDSDRHGFALTLTLLLPGLGVALLAQFGTDWGWLHARLDSYRVLWPQTWDFFTGLAHNDALVAYRVGQHGELRFLETQRAGAS